MYARNRSISNLLPLIRNATSLRRVVTTFIATLEGDVKMDDFQVWHMKLMENRDHAASVTTLPLEGHQKAAPEVSFVHTFPGVVKSGITRGTAGPLFIVLKVMFTVFGSLVYMSTEEAGDRHVFLCTYARYSASAQDSAAAVPLSDTEGFALARGTDGKIGCGVYSVDASGESAKPEVERILAGLRNNGMVETVMDRIDTDIKEALASRKELNLPVLELPRT